MSPTLDANPNERKTIISYASREAGSIICSLPFEIYSRENTQLVKIGHWLKFENPLDGGKERDY